jgi:hypothetical protein
VKPGSSKHVEWRVEEELKTYKGDVTFEIRGKQNVLRFQFKSPTLGKSVRKGKRLNIEWAGGIATEEVRISLHQGDLMVAPVTEIRNTGGYIWQLPKDVKKGKGYYLKMTSTTSNETISSQLFNVKRKTPAFIKILPILAIAGAAPLFLGGDKPNPGGGGGETPLPSPPGSPD